ncbi:hypothetical protein RUM44_008650 [Polyplax serrata]|uniref:PTHB1 N-terminal domain-containing protein n=2 Tax=Polyplax serrata TaxID=468196 RepID=A0ABR1B8W6_POLSC
MSLINPKKLVPKSFLWNIGRPASRDSTSRDWWEINLNETDSYDSQSLLTLTLENDKFESILLGSHGGFLRLFSPSPKTVDGNVVSTYEPYHLMLEIQLPSPILQIDEGILVS